MSNEIDANNVTIWGGHKDPRIVFDETRCTECDCLIGPTLGSSYANPDIETGVWIACFDTPTGLCCENCADQ